MTKFQAPRQRVKRHGQIIVMLLVLMVGLGGFMGLACDAVFAFVVKSQLTIAVDAAALAASRALNKGANIVQQQASVNQTVAEMMAANFPAGLLQTRNLVYEPPTVVDNGDGTRTVSVLGHVDSPTFFMTLLGWNAVPVSALGQSVRRDVVLTLVLDRSGSMNGAPGYSPGPTAFDDLKAASLEFLDFFDNTRDQLGLVVFGSSTRLEFMPATNFKGPIAALINAHVAETSGTNAPDGLWTAYAALTAIGSPTALNVIVFFTDGVATGFSGDFAVNKGLCAGSVVSGVAQTYSEPNNDAAKGLLVYAAGPPPVTGDELNYQTACGWNDADLRSRIDFIPPTDTHGTSIMGPRIIPFMSGGSVTMRGRNIKTVADNLSVNTAARARRDPDIAATIYTIGLGGGAYPADDELLRMIANDPASVAYDSSEPRGLYVYAPDASQLRNAFRRVASQVTRLIN
jgi:Flp pilus assembly protein TadG